MAISRPLTEGASGPPSTAAPSRGGSAKRRTARGHSTPLLHPPTGAPKPAHGAAKRPTAHPAVPAGGLSHSGHSEASHNMVGGRLYGGTSSAKTGKEDRVLPFLTKERQPPPRTIVGGPAKPHVKPATHGGHHAKPPADHRPAHHKAPPPAHHKRPKPSGTSHKTGGVASPVIPTSSPANDGLGPSIGGLNLFPLLLIAGGALALWYLYTHRKGAKR